MGAWIHLFQVICASLRSIPNGGRLRRPTDKLPHADFRSLRCSPDWWPGTTRSQFETRNRPTERY